METDFDPKDSDARQFLAEGRINIGNLIRTIYEVVLDPYTYNYKKNPFMWFGFFWGLPIPVYFLWFQYSVDPIHLSSILLEPSIHWFFAVHPPLFALFFGAVGTFYWNYHASLQHKATHDGLTNLLTHSTFQEISARRLEEAERYDKILSLVMIDLDHFKQVNDTLGHKEGDRVLVTIAEYLREATRTSDIVGRYGGEEFALLLPETSMNDAYTMANRICENVAQNSDTLPDFMTISGGVATFPLNETSLEGLVKLADRCLYEAKESGRNRICIPPDLPNDSTADRERIIMDDWKSKTGTKEIKTPKRTS